MVFKAGMQSVLPEQRSLHWSSTWLATSYRYSWKKVGTGRMGQL